MKYLGEEVRKPLGFKAVKACRPVVAGKSQADFLEQGRGLIQEATLRQCELYWHLPPLTVSESYWQFAPRISGA